MKKKYYQLAYEISRLTEKETKSTFKGISGYQKRKLTHSSFKLLENTNISLFKERPTFRGVYIRNDIGSLGLYYPDKKIVKIVEDTDIKTLIHELIHLYQYSCEPEKIESAYHEYYKPYTLNGESESRNYFEYLKCHRFFLNPFEFQAQFLSDDLGSLYLALLYLRVQTGRKTSFYQMAQKYMIEPLKKYQKITDDDILIYLRMITSAQDNFNELLASID